MPMTMTGIASRRTASEQQENQKKQQEDQDHEGAANRTAT
jgi:hypothetical protein